MSKVKILYCCNGTCPYISPEPEEEVNERLCEQQQKSSKTLVLQINAKFNSLQVCEKENSKDSDSQLIHMHR